MSLYKLIIAASLCVAFAFATGNDPGLENTWNADNQQHFIENKGQVYNLSNNTPNPEVRFMLERPGMKVFLMNNGISTQFEQMHYPTGYQELMQDVHKEPGQEQQLDELQKEVRLETWRVDMRLLGANPSPNITTEGKSDDYTHYYNRDVLFVHHFQKITYHDIYPGIDWVVYTQEGGMKYDFIVHPGADPSQIRMQYTHQESLELDQNGNLNVYTAMGQFTEKSPVSFQGGKSVQTSFKKEGDVIRFNLDSFDHTKSLIIDPLIRLWGTYYGGSDMDRTYSTTTDLSLNVYLSGDTYSSNAIALGGHQNMLIGTRSTFLVKFNKSGIRIWGTYYGESIGGDYCTFVSTDTAGNAYLVGHTGSASGIAYGGHQNAYGGMMDAFLVKFDSSGVRKWGTYYGGTEDDTPCFVTTDNSGNIYITGKTYSSMAIAYMGHQNSLTGNCDAFLVKFNSAGIRQWGTYYGGSSLDIGYSITTDSLGNVYLAGQTASSTNIAFGGHKNMIDGGYDAFLVKFNESGVRQWGTYYGGELSEEGNSTATDKSGNVYLAGGTSSSSAISYCGHQNTFGGSYDAYLVKFNSAGVRQWGTFYGGTDEDCAYTIITDDVGNVYMGGITNSNYAISNFGYQNSYGGGASDAFLVKFNSAGIRQWGTYFGGNDSDYGYSTAIDEFSYIYLAGTTKSTGAIAYGGHQNTYGGGDYDAFLVKFSESGVDIDIVSTNALQIYPNPVKSEINVSNMSANSIITLCNPLGQVVLETQSTSTELKLNLSDLPAGVYTLQISNQVGTVSKKIVIQ